MNQLNQTNALHLVLSYTGAWSLAQIGMVRALGERGVNIARITASGLGALVGALWACESDLAMAASVLSELPWERAEQECDTWLRLLTKGKTLEETHRALHIVAGRLDTSERVVIGEGRVADAVRRAIGLTGWVTPASCGHTLWGDLGLAQLPHGEGHDRLPCIAAHISGTSSLFVSRSDALLYQANGWASGLLDHVGIPGPRVIFSDHPSRFDAVQRMADAVYEATLAWLDETGALHANG